MTDARALETPNGRDWAPTAADEPNQDAGNVCNNCSTARQDSRAGTAVPL